MSLDKVGKLTRNFNAVKNGTGSLKDFYNAVSGIGDLDKAAEYLVKNNKKNGIDKSNLVNILLGAFQDKNETQVTDSLDKALSKSSTIMGTGFSLKNIGDSIKNTGSGLLTLLKPYAPLIVGTIVTGLGVAGFKALDNAFDLTKGTTTKKYESAKEKHENAQADLETAQSEYASNQERIYELRAQENRSLSESQELSNLQNQNELLGAQVSLKERLVNTAKIAEADAAQKDLNKKYSQSNYSKDINGVYNPQNKVNVNDMDEAQAMIDYIQYQQGRYDTAYSNIKERHNGDMTQITEEENATLEKQQANIDKYKADLSEKITGISESAQSLVGEDGKALDAKYQGTLDQIDSLVSNYTSLIGAASGTEDKLNNLFALADYADFQSKLESIGKSKGTEGILDILNSDETYKKLNSALEERQISADDLAAYIMSIADPETKSIEGIKQNFKDIMGGSNVDKNGNALIGPSLYDAFFKNKSDKDIEGFWNYIQSHGLNPQDENWSSADYSHNWDDYIKSQKKAEAESTLFSSKFKNSTEDTATDLDTITDNFQTDMSNIKSAMDSIKSGTFQNSDITDLIQQFPELATETDNLQQGLQKLTFDKASDAIGKIRDSVKDVTDPKELAAADKYVQSIMDTMDLSGMSMNDMKSQIQKNISTNAENEHMVDQTISNLMDKYGNDEYAVQAILKLSVDEEFVNDRTLRNDET